MKASYPIEYGDRIFVRAIQDGVRVLEMTVTNVSDLTSLVREIRHAGRQADGLVRLFVRNHSKGWSMERPLRFYGGMPTPQRRQLNAAGAVRRMPTPVAPHHRAATSPRHRPSIPSSRGRPTDATLIQAIRMMGITSRPRPSVADGEGACSIGMALSGLRFRIPHRGKW